MKVKTIKNHENDYGTRDGLPYEKANGRVYELDDETGQALIDAGFVEKVSERKSVSE